MSIAGAVGAAIRPPAMDADDLRLLAAGIDPRLAAVDLKFTRGLYRIGLGRPYVSDFVAAGGTVTGGAGFATAVNAAGQVIGPFASNTLPATDAGVEVWEARTNLFLWSQVFNDVLWIKTSGGGASISQDAATAPDGTVSADKLIELTGTGFHMVDKTVSAASGSTLTLSVFAKSAERSRVVLNMTDLTTGDATATFNVATGVAASTTSTGSWTAVTSSIIALGSGWYRCTLTATKGAGTSVGSHIRLDNGSTSSYTGDGSSGLFVWGAQLEAGSFPSPYIPTTTAAATRTAIAPSITGLASILTPPFTVFSRVTPRQMTQSGLVLEVGDGTANNRIGLQLSSGNTPRYFQVRGGVSAGEPTGTASAASVNTPLRFALRVKTGDYKAAVGGVLFGGATGTVPSGLTVIGIGRRNDALLEPPNATIPLILILPDMSDAQLQALTA